MPTKLHMTRTPVGLVPCDQQGIEWLNKVALGKPVDVSVAQPRNGRFHRKFFAMLNVAYENHEWPELDTQWGKATVSFDLFRKYVTVRAGHYEAALTPHGEVRAEPKSIAFSSMDEDDFSRVYSDVLNVILREFLTNWTHGDMDHAVNQMMAFA